MKQAFIARESGRIGDAAQCSGMKCCVAAAIKGRWVLRLAVVAGALAVASVACAQDVPADAPYKNPALPFDQRVADLMSRMTRDEKYQQLRSAIPRNARLDIPAVDWWSEGNHGMSRSSGFATVFPDSIFMASAWDPALMQKVGDAIGDEARAKFNPSGVRYNGIILWSPTINMARDPRWGRTEETYGEDPWLTSRLAIGFIKGLQGDDPKYLKTVATVKHFAMHSQETQRHERSFDCPENIIRDYYFPAFRDCVTEGHVASVMTAFSGINKVPDTANAWLVTDVLRKQWGFEGAVVTDWEATRQLVNGMHYATNDTDAAAKAINAGVDVLCDEQDWGRIAAAAVTEGKLSDEAVDRAVSRNLLLRFRLGMFDPPDLVPFTKIPKTVVDSKEHRALALESAKASMVLLKNDAGPAFGKLLPLDLRRINTIAVIGPYADTIQFGAYSGTPSGPSLSVYRALRAAVGDRVQVKTVSSADDVGALRLATASDVVVFVCGLNGNIEKEGIDRTSLKLPESQQALLARVMKVNPATVMLLEGGGAVGLEWAKANVPAIMWIGYPGEEGGPAVAQTLLGENNPAGRLPMTFYRDSTDLPALDDYDITKGRTYMYLTKPAPYVFGAGLSYTTFKYEHVQVTPAAVSAAGTINVSVDVTNTGAMDGDEVVQLYVHQKNAGPARPIRQLKGFSRVTIAKGETKHVTFAVAVEKLAFWDMSAKKYVVDAGTYEMEVGASSDDIRGVAEVKVGG